MFNGDTMVLPPWAAVAFSTPRERSHFYGYYYHSPLSADGHHLLAHRVGFDGRKVEASDHADVGYFDLRDGSWHVLGTTKAFNWQQGATLQWLGPDFQSRIIYNDQEDDRFVSHIIEVSSRVQRTVPHAVYEVHPSGRTALGVQFKRHYFCRAYHYEGIRDDRWNVPLHPEDGISAIDLDAGTARLLLRTADIACLDTTPAMAGVPHWLEHLLWNPSGTRFGFLHRFGSLQTYGTRVFTADAHGGTIFRLLGHEDYSFSHMGWRDDSRFVNFGVKTKPLTQAYSAMVGSSNSLKKALVAGWRAAKWLLPRDFTDRRRAAGGYALVRDRHGVEKWLSTGWLRRDGHPSWTKDGRFMLTDTYADETGYRHLLLYDTESARLHSVGRFFSPFNACSYRCDLHPRFSRDERRIIIDTAHTGRHQMMVLDVDWKRLQL